MSLRNKTTKATIIMLLGHGGGQLIRFGGSLVTTRLLAPDLFGVMAIANSMVIMAALFSDLGFRLNVVRSPRGGDPQFLQTIFSFKVLQGLFLFLIIVASTCALIYLNGRGVFPQGSAYAHTDLPVALFIVAFSPLIGGFKSIQLDVHVRRQSLGGQTILELVSQVFALTFIILTGWKTPSIYSLAFSNVVAATITTAGSYLVFERKLFGFAWEKESVKEIFLFGKWIFASTAVTALSNNIDKFLIGYYLNSIQMGVYSIAWLIFVAVGNIFNKLMTPLFSALSEVVRERPKDVSRVYYKIRLYLDFITCLPVCLVITNGDYLINFLYDDRYKEAGYFLQLMCVSYLIDCFLFKNQVITAMGKSKIQFQLSVWRLLGVCMLIPVGNYYFGVTGIILAVAFRRLFGVWILFYIFYEKKLLNWKKELRTVGVIVLCFIIGLIFRMALEQFISYQP